MDKKVIYVDFNAASKVSKENYAHNTKASSCMPQNQSFIEKILEKFKKLFSKFRKGRAHNSDLSRHKHWL